jgi:hypothetical protein
MTNQLKIDSTPQIAKSHPFPFLNQNYRKFCGQYNAKVNKQVVPLQDFFGLG